MTGAAAVRLEPFGDAAVLVVLGDASNDETTARVHRAAEALAALRQRDPRFGQPVAAYTTVLVPVDPLDPGVTGAVEIVAGWLGGWHQDEDERDPPARDTLEIPTRYGGADGPDLEEIAELHGLRPTDVIEIHASATYRVHFLGFVPGFAYLRTVPAAIATPRLASPRVRVPAGSVAIADDQTAVYPFPSPGGWRLIGRTDVRVWDPSAERPALFEPGMLVRFVPVAP